MLLRTVPVVVEVLLRIVPVVVEVLLRTVPVVAEVLLRTVPVVVEDCTCCCLTLGLYLLLFRLLNRTTWTRPSPRRR